MKPNEGKTDRMIRGVVGVVALVAALATGLGSALGIVLAVVGVVMLVTGAVGFCPIYRVIGMNTCPVGTKDA